MTFKKEFNLDIKTKGMNPVPFDELNSSLNDQLTGVFIQIYAHYHFYFMKSNKILALNSMVDKNV